MPAHIRVEVDVPGMWHKVSKIQAPGHKNLWQNWRHFRTQLLCIRDTKDGGDECAWAGQQTGICVVPL